MKRPFLLVAVLLALAGLALSELRKAEAPVSPAPLLFFLADTQRELTRMPMQVTRLSDEKEVEIGDQLARRYLAMLRRAPETPEDQAIAEYVRGVGQRVAAHAARRLPYQFHYIPDVNFINAFALPGGHVFIGEGLISLMQTEDALAGILGHEIEHIDHYHCVERVQIEAALRRIPLGDVAALPVAVFVAGYTKDQELQADREGARLAARAGYAPLEVIAVFQEFEKLYHTAQSPARNPADELSRVALETLQGYFRSHPLPEERIAAVQREVGSGPWPAPRPLEYQYIFLRQQAFSAVRDRRYAAAVTLATRALVLKPDDVAALTALAQARFALKNYPAALENYRDLAALDAVAASEVRSFAVLLASEALKRQDWKTAAELSLHALDFEPVSLEAYLVRIRALLNAGDVEAAWETTQQLLKIAPGGQGELPDVARRRAEQLMLAHDYTQAERLAGYPLRILPDHPDYLPVYARAAFAAGDFATAADADLKLVTRPQVRNWEAPLHAAADAFAAAGQAPRGIAALEAARAAVRKAEDSASRDAAIQVELAGLRLYTGDEKAARRYADYIRAGKWGEIPVIGLDRIGFWYYRAGQAQVAVELLPRLVGVPSDSQEEILELAWAQLEYASSPAAAAGFRNWRGNPMEWRVRADAPIMGQALASWLMGQREEALGEFSSAVLQRPEWLNANWVGALYPSNTARMAADLYRERQRREAASKALAQTRR
ncbi:MAG TPA: M48 family metalloprotease [Candidatus Binatia bacterium]|nr:M48 family metalloprotease [Candidatus Binatia bacterium]